MKKKTVAAELKPFDLEAVCERTRQVCNRLGAGERRELQQRALAIINGQDEEPLAGRA